MFQVSIVDMVNVLFLWLDPDFGMIFLYVFVPHLTWLTLRNCLKLICLKNVTTYMNLLNRNMCYSKLKYTHLVISK